jgi:hypothetical protein
VKLRTFDLQLPLYGVVMEAQPDQGLTDLIVNHNALQIKS